MSDDKVIVSVEEIPGGFQAATENGNTTKTGYFGRTRGDALLSMLLFAADGLENLAGAAARDAREIRATAQAAAQELGVKLNPNAPTTTYEVTGEMSPARADRDRARANDLERRLREALQLKATCPNGCVELLLPEEEGTYCRACGEWCTPEPASSPQEQQ